MRNLVAGSLVAAALSFGLAGMPALAADADPSVQQIYEAARSGHLDQAQQMMNQVLRDHPESSKAHYVQSELYAREGNPGLGALRARPCRTARSRFDQGKPAIRSRAQSPARSRSQKWRFFRRPMTTGRAFGASLSVGHRGDPRAGGRRFLDAVPPPAHLRRSTRPGGAPGAYGPGGYAGPGPGPGYGSPGGGMAGGGIGSNIAGGLAGGLAAGAGIVAGEELAHHFLDGDRRQVLPPPNDDGSFGSAIRTPTWAATTSA